MRSSWIEINLNNVLKNINEIKKTLKKNVKFMAIVKTNAYGHGSVKLSRYIEDKVDAFGVAIIEEAILLRKNKIKKPILVLGYTDKFYYPWIIKYNIIQTIFSEKQAFYLNKTAKEMNKVATIHLKLETGMNRIGFTLDDYFFVKIIKKINKLPFLNIEGIFSHIANGGCDDLSYTKIQIKKFKFFSNIVENILEKKVLKHIANSATLIEIPESHFDMVRSGIFLYGCYSTENKNKDKIKLKKVLTLKSKIIQIKLLKKNEPISYCGSFITKKETKVAVISIGYGDGIFRNLSNKAYFLLKKKLVKSIGNICMNQLMIDISDIKNVKIGDEIILFGEKNPVENFAKILNTISYEIFCSINDRVPRIYIKKI